MKKPRLHFGESFTLTLWFLEISSTHKKQKVFCEAVRPRTRLTDQRETVLYGVKSLRATVKQCRHRCPHCLYTVSVHVCFTLWLLWHIRGQFATCPGQGWVFTFVCGFIYWCVKNCQDFVLDGDRGKVWKEMLPLNKLTAEWTVFSPCCLLMYIWLRS